MVWYFCPCQMVSRPVPNEILRLLEFTSVLCWTWSKFREYNKGAIFTTNEMGDKSLYWFTSSFRFFHSQESYQNVLRNVETASTYEPAQPERWSYASDEYELWTSSLCTFRHSPITTYLSSPNIIPSTLFWKHPASTLLSSSHSTQQVEFYFCCFIQCIKMYNMHNVHVLE
jgi:hypothetical protein